MDFQPLQIGSQTIATYQSLGTEMGALLVHGNSASGQWFRPQLESPLGEKYRLVAIDLPGHGRSSPAPDPQSTYSLPGYASVVAQVAERLGLQEGVFVGWSLGGHIILEAVDQLSQAAGFMIFGTPPVSIPPAMEQAFLPHPSNQNLFKEDFTEEDAALMVRSCFRPGVAGIPEDFKAFVLQTDGRARALLGQSIGAGNAKDEIEIVATLTVPLAVLHGQQEQAVNGDYIAGLDIPTLWRGEIQMIPDAGHALQWEQPEQFNALLQAFMEETIQ